MPQGNMSIDKHSALNLKRRSAGKLMCLAASNYANFYGVMKK
jgi:hypothetical protein